MVAPESSALTALDFQFLQDIDPGQSIIIDEQGVVTKEGIIKDKMNMPCLFEFVYFLGQIHLLTPSLFINQGSEWVIF